MDMQKKNSPSQVAGQKCFAPDVLLLDAGSGQKRTDVAPTRHDLIFSPEKPTNQNNQKPL